jgi:hypothetical protein
MDAPEFWPVYEAAAVLRAPLHLHPQSPAGAVRAAHYDAPLSAAFAIHGIGWHYESGVHLLRLILSGVFDRFPDLQVDSMNEAARLTGGSRIISAATCTWPPATCSVSVTSAG